LIRGKDENSRPQKQNPDTPKNETPLTPPARKKMRRGGDKKDENFQTGTSTRSKVNERRRADGGRVCSRKKRRKSPEGLSPGHQPEGESACTHNVCRRDSEILNGDTHTHSLTRGRKEKKKIKRRKKRTDWGTSEETEHKPHTERQ